MPELNEVKCWDGREFKVGDKVWVPDGFIRGVGMLVGIISAGIGVFDFNGNTGGAELKTLYFKDVIRAEVSR